jgi:hypothetical protein
MLATQTSGPGEPCEWVSVEVQVSTGEGTRLGTSHVLSEIYIKEIEIQPRL